MQANTHLFQLLAHEYYNQLKQTGQSDQQAAAAIEKLKPFLEYARNYLTINRVGQALPVDGNLLLRLTNGKETFASPGFAGTQPGTMVPSSAVQVSHGLGQPNMGMVDSGYIPVGHQPHSAPIQHQSPFVEIAGARDYTQSTSPIDFTRPDAQMPR